MIVIDFCLFQVPTTVQKFGTNDTNSAIWLLIYHIYERIQLIIFTLQELVISAIYIRATVKILSPSDPEGTRRTKWFLIYLNVLCIALDVIVVAEVFTGQWGFEEATQSLIYAVKLTLEFVVLNKLMDVLRNRPGTCATCSRRPSSGFPWHSHASPRRVRGDEGIGLATSPTKIVGEGKVNDRKPIVVTTGITTWREDRDSYHGSRLADAATP